ncbi:MAG: sulfotransferase domain-containing protein [Gammaproteobacteria bacterium]
MIQRRPNFFVAGAPKCGTTALFQYLWAHPNVFTPSVKEPTFFADDFPGIRDPIDTLDKYLDLFSDAGPEHTAIGDASVFHMYSDVAVQNIYNFNPDAKIILMARNPKELVYSFHSQALYTLNETEKDFEKAWFLQESRRAGKNIPPTCLEPKFLDYEMIGTIAKYFKKVYEIFPDKQIKILFMDDLKKDTEAVFRDTLNYLELQDFKPDSYAVVNAQKANRSNFIASLSVRPPPPALRRVASIIKKNLGLKNVSFRQLLESLNRDSSKRKPLSPQMISLLQETFVDDIRELEKLSGRKLEAWLK